MEKIFSGHQKNRKSFSEFITEEEKVKIPNKGDLAEAILACGVAAKFFDPTAVVTKVSIEKMLGKVLSTRKTKLERGDMSAKTTVKVSDTITLSVGIRAREWEFISDRKNWPLIEWQFTSVAKYCNTYKRLLRYASILYRNNKENKIVVDADGLTDQKGTKADIKVKIDDKVVNMQMSLKVTGGDQIGQMSGVPFDRQISLFELLGVDVSPARKKYEEKLKEVDITYAFTSRDLIKSPQAKKIQDVVRQANAFVHQEAAEKLEKLMRSKDTKFIEKLTDFLRKAATGNDPTIEVVKLSTKGYKRAKFGKKYVQNMKEAMDHLKVEYRRKTGDPETIVYDPRVGASNNSSARLFKVRAKIIYESKKRGGEKIYPIYVRNLIESGDLMFDLASDL